MAVFFHKPSFFHKPELSDIPKSEERIKTYNELPKKFKDREKVVHFLRWIFISRVFKEKALDKYNKNFLTEKKIASEYAITTAPSSDSAMENKEGSAAQTLAANNKVSVLPRLKSNIAKIKNTQDAKQKSLSEKKKNKDENNFNEAKALVSSTVVFGSAPVKTTEEKIKASYQGLIDHGLDCLFSGMKGKKDAVAIVINALLVKECGFDYDNQEKGGVSFSMKSNQEDLSNVNVILQGEGNADKSESFKRYNLACTKIKAMLNKHRNNIGQRSGGKSNGSSIFAQMTDRSSEKFSVDKVSEIKRAFNLLIDAESGQVSGYGISIVDHLTPLTDKEKMKNEFEDFYLWSAKGQEPFGEAYQFLAKTLLHAEGVFDFQKERGVKQFDKAYVNDDVTLAEVKSAISRAKTMIGEHRKHLANTVVSGYIPEKAPLSAQLQASQLQTSQLQTSELQTSQLQTSELQISQLQTSLLQTKGSNDYLARLEESNKTQGGIKSGMHIVDLLDDKVDSDTKDQIADTFNTLLDKALPEYSLSADEVAERVKSADGLRGAKAVKKKSGSVAFSSYLEKDITPEADKKKREFERRMNKIRNEYDKKRAKARRNVADDSPSSSSIKEEKETDTYAGFEVIFNKPVNEKKARRLRNKNK